ncbi:hypothetical protein [Streptomyces sp. NPDC057690]|uniref:hypothetical protein n=1 Tax=Streptomyces sp. NPDC057690 TaxID=3346214 RepID=UPI003678B2C1
MVEKIIYLRQTYHFRPKKIAMYPKRYLDVTISKSSVWRILDRLGMDRLSASPATSATAARPLCLDHVIQQLPFRVEVLQADNDAEVLNDKLRKWKDNHHRPTAAPPARPTNASSRRRRPRHIRRSSAAHDGEHPIRRHYCLVSLERTSSVARPSLTHCRMRGPDTGRLLATERWLGKPSI